MLAEDCFGPLTIPDISFCSATELLHKTQVAEDSKLTHQDLALSEHIAFCGIILGQSSLSEMLGLGSSTIETFASLSSSNSR